MAAPFWRNRPRAKPPSASEAVLTVCGRLMSAKVSQSIACCNLNRDTNSHHDPKTAVEDMQRNTVGWALRADLRRRREP